MRWPWQRGADEPRTGPTPGDPGPAAAPEPPVAPAGWAFLPPLQRTAAGIELTSRPDHFTGSLASWGDPSFIGPMTHLVSTAAPAGVIDVDGGGPATGSSGYVAPSVEMALLPAPAPRVRPEPARPGNAGSLQRATFDGGSPAGGSLLTAASRAFPVLHVQAQTLQPSESPPEPEVSTEPSAWLPEPEVSAQPEPLPEREGSTQTESQTARGTYAPAAESTGPDTLWAGGPAQADLPNLPSLPRNSEGSTSDAHATYVPLPSPPAVQRLQDGTAAGQPKFPRVPYPSKLGFGAPLSFSDPAAPTEPGSAGALSRLPVQRSSTRPPGSSGPSLLNPQAPEAESGKPDGTVVRQDQPEPPPPSEARTVPAVTAADSAAPAAQGGPVAAREATGPGPGAAGAADMPVISRLAPAVDGDGAGVAAGAGDTRGANDGSREDADARESRPDHVIPENASAQLSEVGVTAAVTGGTTGEPASVQGAAGPLTAFSSRPPLVVARNGLAIAGDGLGQRDVDSGGAAVQREAGLLDSGQRQTGRSDSPRLDSSPLDRGGSDTGYLPDRQADSHQSFDEDPSHFTTSNQPPFSIQRLPQPGQSPQPARSPADPQTRMTAPAADPQTRMTATATDPVVLRIVRTALPGTAPETWQRLTAIPAAVQQVQAKPGLAPAPAPNQGAASGPAVTASNDAPARPVLPADQDSDAAARLPLAVPGDSGSVAGADAEGTLLDGFHSAGPGPAPEPTTDLGAGASAEPDAAVGRSIQRTLALDSPGTRALGGPHASAASWRPVQPHSVINDAGTSPGGPGTGGLQRSVAALATPARPADRDAAGPAVRSAVPAGSPIQGEAPGRETLSLALQPGTRTVAGGDLQRAAVSFPAPELQAGVPAPGTAGTTSTGETSDATSVQTDAESAAAGTPQQRARATENGPVRPQAAGAPAATPEQLEELAKRLTGPLIRRIKAEMLLDRERRGLRTDMN